MIKNNYDVIVVGGGTGGATVSKFLAQRGIKTALIEKSRFEDLHKICGDMIGEDHFQTIEKVDPMNKIEIPHDNEVYNIIRELGFYSPTYHRYKVALNERVWVIARDKFGLRLIREAGDAGVELFEKTTVLHPLLDETGSNVIGIHVKSKNGIFDIKSKIVVDASGMAGIIRRHIDNKKALWDKLIQHYDMAATYRELVHFETPIDSSDCARMYFDPTICPRGYYWIFPQNEHSANVGLGIGPREIAGGPREAYKMWEKREVNLFNGHHKIIHSGGATLPLRRPMDTMVFGGLVLIGDAGACVRATDGAGIGPSMVSASYAVQPIVHALELEDYTRNGPLWDYNIGFMREIASKDAPLALLRVSIAEASYHDIATLLDNQVVDATDLISLTEGDGVDLGIRSILRRAWRGKTILPFLLKMLITLRKMKKAEQLYYNYPDNWQDFIQWKNKIVKLYQDEKRAKTYYKMTNQSKFVKEKRDEIGIRNYQ